MDKTAGPINKLIKYYVKKRYGTSGLIAYTAKQEAKKIKKFVKKYPKRSAIIAAGGGTAGYILGKD